MAAGAAALILAAMVFIFRTASAPRETISTEPVAAKGIDAAGAGGGK